MYCLLTRFIHFTEDDGLTKSAGEKIPQERVVLTKSVIADIRHMFFIR